MSLLLSGILHTKVYLYNRMLSSRVTLILIMLNQLLNKSHLVILSAALRWMNQRWKGTKLVEILQPLGVRHIYLRFLKSHILLSPRVMTLSSEYCFTCIKVLVITKIVHYSAADDDPLPAVEGLQISGEAFPGRELQASGYSINGTTSCNFEVLVVINKAYNLFCIRFLLICLSFTWLAVGQAFRRWIC